MADPTVGSHETLLGPYYHLILSNIRANPGFKRHVSEQSHVDTISKFTIVVAVPTVIMSDC